MKTLDQHSTEIFCLLLNKMNGKQHLTIDNEPFMPLTIEKVGEAYGGEAGLYSLCHYYEQNGDLMQDPEMCFIVVDGRMGEQKNFEQVQITPYMYQQVNLGIYQESIIFKNGVIRNCIDDLQLEQAVFANQWLQNIQEQGFLNK